MDKEIRVMLVDDHKMIRDGIRLMIKNDPIVKIVCEAQDGLEAIEYINNNPLEIDVVLMDISMPKLDGIAATHNIKTNHPDIKVLALTMHLENSYISKMMKAGVSGYILKDSSRFELIDAIKKIAEGKLYYSADVSSVLLNSIMTESTDKKRTKDVVSDREKEVAVFIAKGLTSAEIGEELHVSARTVESHRRNIISKLDLKNTAQMISYAIKHGWI